MASYFFVFRKKEFKTKQHTLMRKIGSAMLCSIISTTPLVAAVPTYAATSYSTYDNSLTYQERLSQAQAGTQKRRTHYPTIAEPMYNSKSSGEYYGANASKHTNSRTRKYQTQYGYYNPYDAFSGVKGMNDLGDALPNCVAYTWGRTFETLGYGTAKILWEGTLHARRPSLVWQNNVNSNVFAHGTIPKNNSLLVRKDSEHIMYVESATNLGNGLYQLEITDSNASANGYDATTKWPKNKAYTCGTTGNGNSAAWRRYTTYYNAKTKYYSQNKSYAQSATSSSHSHCTPASGLIYLTQPLGKYVNMADDALPANYGHSHG